MIINNTHITGIYIYSDKADYEKGDFVVKDDCIYLCTASNPTNLENNTVTGKDPSSDKINFSLYPGEMISTADEFFKYSENLASNTYSEDKYISSHILYNILQKLYFGLDNNGIIKDSIKLNSDDTINYSVDSAVENLDASIKVLDKVLSTESLNNGVVLVSRSLPEIASLFGTPSGIDNNSYYSSSNDVVILKQYTYIDTANGNSIYYRVQELIDSVYGETYLRFSKGTEGESVFKPTLVSSWKVSFLGDRTVKDKLNAISNYYNERITDLENEKNSLKGSFKYKNLFNNSSSGRVSSFYFDWDYSGTIIDFTSTNAIFNTILSVKIKDNLYRNYEVIFDTMDSTTIGKLESEGLYYTDYYVTDSIKLRVYVNYLQESTSTSAVDGKIQRVTVEVLDNDVENIEKAFISNIYYRKNYE